MNTKRLVVAGYIDGPWQCIEVDPAFGEVELWDHDMADFVSIDPFDVPSECSYFAHLMPCKPQANMLVSRYMNKAGFASAQDNYFLDGHHAAIEGQPLAAMPTEYHEAGWWDAAMGQSEIANRYDGDIEDDYEDIRRGY